MYDRMRGFCASFLLMAFVLFYTGTARSRTTITGMLAIHPAMFG